MTILPKRLAASASLALLLAACGGGDTTDMPTSSTLSQRPTMHALKGGGGGTGSGGGTVSTPSPLPTTAPAPDILVRESFGPGPNILRPKGGKGTMTSSALHVTIGGFWVEWPGSKNTQWMTPNGDQTWKFAGIGGYLDPYELPSPLQPDETTQGVAFSEYFDAVTQYPTALLPIVAPTTPWAVSIETVPAPIAGAYTALGLSNSAILLSNFTTVAPAALIVRYAAGNSQITYELRLNGSVVATGATDDLTYNQLVLAYDPAARQLRASVNGIDLGSFAINLGAPRYAGFEGVGMVDNFVLRKLP